MENSGRVRRREMERTEVEYACYIGRIRSGQEKKECEGRTEGGRGVRQWKGKGMGSTRYEETGKR